MNNKLNAKTALLIVFISLIFVQKAFACSDLLPKSFKCEKLASSPVSGEYKIDPKSVVINFHRIDMPGSKLINNEISAWLEGGGKHILFQRVHAHSPKDFRKINVSSSIGEEFYTSLNFQIDLNNPVYRDKLIDYSSSDIGRTKPDIEKIAEILGVPIKEIIRYEEKSDNGDICKGSDPFLMMSLFTHVTRYCSGLGATLGAKIEAVPAFYVAGEYLISPKDTNFSISDIRVVLKIVEEIYDSKNTQAAWGFIEA